MEAFSGVYSIFEDDSPTFANEDREDGDVRLASQLEVQQLRTAGGPFLDIWEDDKGQWWSYLKDTTQARNFCVREVEETEVDSYNYSATCAKCSSTLESTKWISFTERQLHLSMTLTTLLHLNNLNFQNHIGIVPAWISEIVAASANKNAAGKNDGDDGHDDHDDHDDEASLPAVDQSLADEAAGDLPPAVTGAKQDYEALTSVHDESEGRESSRRKKEQKAAEKDYIESTADALMYGETADDVFQDCKDCEASDDSRDDDERSADFYNVDTEDDDTFSAEDYWRRETATQFRYEVNCWYYHLREAEALWTPAEQSQNQEWRDIMSELDKLVGNSNFFSKWQQVMWLREMDSDLDTLPWKPLHVAAYLGLTSWAAFLIAHGHGTNERIGRKTSLHAAASRAESLEMAKLLLENHADPNTYDELAYTPLQLWISRNPSYDAVALFIKHGACLNDSKPGMTVMHTFALSGKGVASVLELLLDEENGENKADINALTLSHNTPIQFLLSRRDVSLDLLKAFIKHKADVNSEDSDSQRPLQNASVWGDKEIVKTILPCVTNINDPDRHGTTALHEAALAKNRDLVELLIKHGADPQCRDFHSRTPLFSACLVDPKARLGDSRRTISFLIEELHQNGCTIQEINQPTMRGRTPLRQVAMRGFTDLLDDLLHMLKASPDTDLSAAVNLTDTKNGRTALHCAALNGHKDCVSLLLAYGADIGIRDNAEKTALTLCYEQWALSNETIQHEDTVFLLCERFPKEVAADRELPAIAAMRGSKRVLEQLSSRGVNLDKLDQYGWTPLMMATRFHSAGVEAYLKEQTARRSSLPTRWLDPNNGTGLANDGRTVRHTSDERICISSDKPLPGTVDKYYFEITFPKEEGVEQVPNPSVAIGFCTPCASGLRFPGWPPVPRAAFTRSWAYHGDDSGLFSGDGNHHNVIEFLYGPGDTVGCGVDLESCTVWFTKGKMKLSRTFEGVSGRLFPVLGFKDAVYIETNFGTDPSKPFVWNEGWKADEAAKIPALAEVETEPQANAGSESTPVVEPEL